jgi:pyridoxal phosphate enzyme (YggS family)
MISPMDAADGLTMGRSLNVAKRTPLGEKLDEIRERIASACARAKRQTSEVTLIAVTKTAAPEQIREILQLGVGDLGESRAQQLSQRAMQLNEFYQRRKQHGDIDFPEKLRWHMIGHLQRNKVRMVLDVASLVHSIDSLRLAEELDIQATKRGKKQPVLLQVNASEEASKFGVAVGAAVHLAEQIDSMPGLQIVGIMTMAEAEESEAKIRHTFTRTREIFEELRWHKIGGSSLKHLSMGMSHDFEWAIEEGATMIRVGTALFGGKPADEVMEKE